MKREKQRDGAKEAIKLRNTIRTDTDGCSSEAESRDEIVVHITGSYQLWALSFFYDGDTFIRQVLFYLFLCQIKRHQVQELRVKTHLYSAYSQSSSLNAVTTAAETGDPDI